MFNHWDTDVILFWGAIVLIVLISNAFSFWARASKHRMIEKMVEKGQTISPELLAGISNGNSRDGRHASPIQSGIFLICVGIALFFFFWAIDGGGSLIKDGEVLHWLPAVAIFPFMVGLARLLGGLTDRRPPK